LGTIGLSTVVFALAETGGLSAPLSAASAVLLAAPLLAVRRAAESPLLAAAANAGSRGIVFQNAGALDLAGRVSVVAMSPYGTLTEGKPEVLEVLPVAGDDAEGMVALAAAAEAGSVGNPIADAVRRYARSNNIHPASVRRATLLGGRGVTALAPGGEEIVIGNRKLLLDRGVSVAAADGAAAAAEASGRTALFVALGGRVRGVLTLQDSLRPGARGAIQRMLDLNQEVVLLTGDQRGTVEKLAAGLDIAHIKAELLPEERGQEVTLLRDTGGKVAAVGHPVDDHAALTAAHVGIVLGAAGSAEGERAIALVTRDLRDAAAALWIARAARERALRATSLAAGAFAVIVAAAAAGLIVPGIAAILAVGVDAHAVRAGARLLRRIALRLPART
jgi:P-type E1-E2 ATPase